MIKIRNDTLIDKGISNHLKRNCQLKYHMNLKGFYFLYYCQQQLRLV